MKPTYEVSAWREGDWWLARVIAASGGADSAPLNALTQARTLTRIDPMARDLVATILDADEDSFDIEIVYALPDEVSEFLSQARGSRVWLDAAQELWQERSTAAARALAEKGYSLRETATLLGLSHQRVDQLLRVDFEYERSNVWTVELDSYAHTGTRPDPTSADPRRDVDVLLIIRDAHGERGLPHSEDLDTQLKDKVRAVLEAYVSRMSQPSPAAPEVKERGRRVAS